MFKWITERKSNVVSLECWIEQKPNWTIFIKRKRWSERNFKCFVLYRIVSLKLNFIKRAWRQTTRFVQNLIGSPSKTNFSLVERNQTFTSSIREEVSLSIEETPSIIQWGNTMKMRWSNRSSCAFLRIVDETAEKTLRTLPESTRRRVLIVFVRFSAQTDNQTIDKSHFYADRSTSTFDKNKVAEELIFANVLD